ncbi:hypothetical protein SJAV_25220 [Sulfurisphaera javensis]|uniref:Uncharacterized protein n=1 Tax=Sulfurisphaera javensis TaxID=2049879 RepID=A0AAT9GUS6_9CREN
MNKSDTKGKIRNHALYFLGVLSYIVSLVPFEINWLRAIILIPIIAYTLPIMEYLQPRAMSLKIRDKDILLIIPAVVPYLFMNLNIYLLIPISLLILTFLLYYLKATMWGTVVGTAFEASLSIVWATFVNNLLFLLPSIYWLLYIFTGALYVEYKIPFRKLSKKAPQISWFISLLLLFFLSIKFPLTLVSLIEPSFRFFNPGDKLKSVKEIKDLGKNGSKKDLIFLGVLTITYTISVMYLHI